MGRTTNMIIKDVIHVFASISKIMSILLMGRRNREHCNYMPSKVWDEISYPFPNFNGTTMEVWEWIINFISHFTMDVITYPCWEFKLVYHGEREPWDFKIGSLEPNPPNPVFRNCLFPWWLIVIILNPATRVSIPVAQELGVFPVSHSHWISFST